MADTDYITEKLDYLGPLYHVKVHSETRITVNTPMRLSQGTRLTVLLEKSDDGEWAAKSLGELLYGAALPDDMSAIRRALASAGCEMGKDPYKPYQISCPWDPPYPHVMVLQTAQAQIAIDALYYATKPKPYEPGPLSAQHDSLRGLSLSDLEALRTMPEESKKAHVALQMNLTEKHRCTISICTPESDVSYSICSACNHHITNTRAQARAVIWWLGFTGKRSSFALGTAPGLHEAVMRQALIYGSVATGLHFMSNSASHDRIPEHLECDIEELSDKAAQWAYRAYDLRQSL